MRVEFIRPAQPEHGPASSDSGHGPELTSSEEDVQCSEDQSAGEQRPSG